MPYPGAPYWTRSLYYWWFEYLRRNWDYRDTCKAAGKGKLAWLYEDFGDVYDIAFMDWWAAHQKLFAEQSALITSADDLHRLGSRQLLALDLRRPLSQLHEEIAVLHAHVQRLSQHAHPQDISTALYPVYCNVSSYTLHRMLRVWDVRQARPNASAYEVGVTAKLKIKPTAGSTRSQARRRLDVDAIKRIDHERQSIANQVNRYLRVAQQYIDNAGAGVFPKAEGR